MRIYRAKDYEEMSRRAAGIVSAQIIMKPDLCARTGNRLHSGRPLQAADRMVPQWGSGFFRKGER